VKQKLLHIFVITWVAVIVSFPGTGKLFAQTVSYSGGAQYSTGSYYFENSTNSFYLSNGFMLQAGKINVSLNVPYVIQSSPWISYTEMGGIPTGGTQSGEVKQAGRHAGQGSGKRGNNITLIDTTSYNQAGFSDPTISASLTILSNLRKRTIISLNSQLKIPVANPSSGFGTGAWDGGVGASFSKGVSNNLMIFGHSAYWWMGDMEEFQLRNVMSYGVGLGFFLNGGNLIFNGSLNGMTKISGEFAAPASIIFGTGINANERIFISANLSAGLSEASPDLGIGLGWTVKL
jgi:hypothetical protein